MKKVNMIVYPPEKVYQNYTSTLYKKLTGGGSFNPNLSNEVTFFHYDIRAG